MCAYEYNDFDPTSRQGTVSDGVEHLAVGQTPASLEDEFPGLAYAVEVLASSDAYNVAGMASLDALRAAGEAINVVRWASIHYGTAHSDADLTASWQSLQHVKRFLRVNDISTRSMSLLLKDLLTVQTGGTPSALLRPRRATGRRREHLRRDLIRGYVAAAMEYVQTTGLSRDEACVWTSRHLPERILASIPAEPGTIDGWHVRFGGDRGTESGPGRVTYVQLRDLLRHEKPDRDQLVQKLASLFEETPPRRRPASDTDSEAQPRGAWLNLDALQVSNILEGLRSAINAIKADPFGGLPDAVRSDSQIIATIRILTKIIDALRDFGVLTSALNDINAELLNLYQGGTPSPLLRSRRSRGRPNQHVQQDLKRGHLAAIIDYQQSARGWTEEEASAWVYSHVPEHVRTSDKLRPKTLEGWRRRWGRETELDRDVVGRIAFVNQHDRLTRDKPTSVQIVTGMRAWFGTAPRQQPE